MKISPNKKSAAPEAYRLLFDRGLKRTSPRLSILNLLLSSKKPLSHHDISTAIPRLDKVTVYRVLSSLLDHNIAHRMETTGHQWRFAVCPCGHTEHCHPHFSCRKCGRMECLPGVKLPRWDRATTGRVVENQEIYLHGLCRSCSEARQ